MLYLITGGSGSGKSAYAEEELLRLARGGDGDLKKYYIATMEPFGEETMEKIERHRRLRAEKGFQTVECYTDLAGEAGRLAEKASQPKEDNVCFSEVKTGGEPAVLLECMSNLAANELYRRGGSRKEITGRIVLGVKELCRHNKYVVAVTNEVCSDCAEYSEEMQEYKRILSDVNCLLAEYADKVTEVVYGIPVEVKDENDHRRRLSGKA